MWVSRKEIEQLQAAVKAGQNGRYTDIRDHREGPLSLLKDDIHALIQRQNGQLAQAEAERDILAEYMADISHQLKTPITSMMIMADLLEDAGPEKQREFLQNIRFSLSRMEWLIGALLKMAKLDAGAVTFTPQDVRVSGLLEAVLPSVDILLDVNSQSLALKQDTTIRCDRRWTTEALTNIVKNAIEHAPEGSEITVDSGANPLYEWISVTDCGDGLEKKQYASLFRRFETSAAENGYGIGMPLALSILKGQNGTIDVEPGRDKKGTTVLLKFFK